MIGDDCCVAIPKEYQSDLAAIVAKRRQHRGDFWATSDGRWGKGSPFSTFDCILLLTELGTGRLRCWGRNSSATKRYWENLSNISG